MSVMMFGSMDDAVLEMTDIPEPSVTISRHMIRIANRTCEIRSIDAVWAAIVDVPDDVMVTRGVRVLKHIDDTVVFKKDESIVVSYDDVPMLTIEYPYVMYTPQPTHVEPEHTILNRVTLTALDPKHIVATCDASGVIMQGSHECACVKTSHGRSVYVLNRFELYRHCEVGKIDLRFEARIPPTYVLS